MNALGRSFFVITTVVSIALAISGCGASAGNLGVAKAPTSEPMATTTPPAAPPATLAPTPSAASSTAGLLLDGEPAALKPGRYVFESSHTGVPAQLANSYPRMSFTVPAGWSGNARLVGKTVADGDPAAPFLLDWQFDHGFQDPCTDHTPVVPKAGSGARWAPRRHRPSARPRRREDIWQLPGGDHGRDRRRPRREVPRLLRHRRSSGLRERARRLLDLGFMPPAGDYRMRGRRRRRRAMGRLEGQPGACLRDRCRRHDLYVLHGPAKQPEGRGSRRVAAIPRLDRVRAVPD